MIGVMGATGQVGKEVVKCLEGRQLPFKALSRPKFDLLKPETYGEMKGVKRLFFVCVTTMTEGEVKAFVEAAEGAGVEQIVLMSGIGAGDNPNHFLEKVERWIHEVGVPCVALRCNWFFQNFGSFFRELVAKDHVLAFPDGGKGMGLVDARDIADVALHYLTAPICDAVVPMTGGEVLTHAEVAQLFTKYLPFEVGYEELSESEAVKRHAWIEPWLPLYADIREGRAAVVADTVQKVLGRAPRRLEAYIAENVASWYKSS